MTELRCEDVEPRLLDMIEGELEAHEHARLEAHLRECETCRQERRQLERLRDALRRDSPPDPGAAFWQQFPDSVWQAYRESIPAVPSATTPSPLQRLPAMLRDFFAGPRWIQAAAALLIAIGAAYFLARAPFAEIDAARYQAQIQSSETLPTLARRAAVELAPPAQFGFGTAGNASFFRVGHWYAEALAHASGNDADGAQERRQAIAAAIGGVAPELADRLRGAGTLAALASLEPRLVRVARAQGERAEVLFRAGLWLANLALAAAASDRMALRLAAAPLARVEHDLDRIEIAPGARRDVEALAELLARGELSEPDIDTVRRLVRRVQTVLL